MDRGLSSEKLNDSVSTLDEQNRHKYYREHILQYAFLILSFAFALIALFRIEEFVWKLAVVIFLAFLYLVFGIWHHLEEKSFSTKHFLEYCLVALIIFLILVSVFL